MKVARRDLPMAVATGALGATTVSATIWAAHKAGIVVSATGGIGGVHPGDGDVSADLLELARTPVFLVCSGPKSIIDATATVDKLGNEVAWDTRVFGERRHTIGYVCDVPATIERRLFSLARAIQEALG